ncbi:hypothetical protein KIPB_007440 [Kipferlia bialata]|uniref:Uncharacterized protein n=1 Tax=Kipferlia bialata TaxID=797122 RepID=A0A9K3GJ26_9EUKA|nr:hypothetical protein KIPB_007440 [Kipferlia bialata]|eukprot:g7440.t1
MPDIATILKQLAEYETTLTDVACSPVADDAPLPDDPRERYTALFDRIDLLRASRDQLGSSVLALDTLAESINQTLTAFDTPSVKTLVSTLIPYPSPAGLTRLLATKTVRNRGATHFSFLQSPNPRLLSSARSLPRHAASYWECHLKGVAGTQGGTSKVGMAVSPINPSLCKAAGLNVPTVAAALALDGTFSVDVIGGQPTPTEEGAPPSPPPTTHLLQCKLDMDAEICGAVGVCFGIGYEPLCGVVFVTGNGRLLCSTASSIPPLPSDVAYQYVLRVDHSQPEAEAEGGAEPDDLPPLVIDMKLGLPDEDMAYRGVGELEF